MAAGIRGRSAGDPAIPYHDIFGFRSMALLLPGITLSLFRARSRTLDRLFGAIDHQHLGFLFGDLGLSFNTDQRPRQFFGSSDRPAYRAFVEVVKEAQELLGDITTIIYQPDQQVIFQTAAVPGAARFGLLALSLFPGGLELFQQLVECADADAGQADDVRAGAQPGGGELDGHRTGTFIRRAPEEPNRPVICQVWIRWFRSTEEVYEPAHFRNGSIEQ